MLHILAIAASASFAVAIAIAAVHHVARRHLAARGREMYVPHDRADDDSEGV
jgi:hypothetical protein